MSRRLLDLCLLAYPRARRERDRAYLRDLALDLAESHGLALQALSLLLGGLRDRIAASRQAGASEWADGSGEPSWPHSSSRRWRWPRTSRSEPPRAMGSASTRSSSSRACMLNRLPPRRDELDSDAGGCPDTRRLVAARERGGWDCKTRRRARQARYSTSWECTRGSSAVG